MAEDRIYEVTSARIPRLAIAEPKSSGLSSSLATNPFNPARFQPKAFARELCIESESDTRNPGEDSLIY